MYGGTGRDVKHRVCGAIWWDGTGRATSRVWCYVVVRDETCNVDGVVLYGGTGRDSRVKFSVYLELLIFNY